MYLPDLNSFGVLVEEILSAKFSPSFARMFLIEILASVNPQISLLLNIWKPDDKEKTINQQASYYQPWLNLDLILYTSIGAGFIALRDDKNISGDKLDEKDLDRVNEIFNKGMMFGYKKSVENFSTSLIAFTKECRIKL